MSESLVAVLDCYSSDDILLGGYRQLKSSYNITLIAPEH